MSIPNWQDSTLQPETPMKIWQTKVCLHRCLGLNHLDKLNSFKIKQLSQKETHWITVSLTNSWQVPVLKKHTLQPRWETTKVPLEMDRMKFLKRPTIARLDGQWLRMLKDLKCLNLNVRRTTNDKFVSTLLLVTDVYCSSRSLEVKVWVNINNF